MPVLPRSVNADGSPAKSAKVSVKSAHSVKSEQQAKMLQCYLRGRVGSDPVPSSIGDSSDDYPVVVMSSKNSNQGMVTQHPVVAKNSNQVSEGSVASIPFAHLFDMPDSRNTPFVGRIEPKFADATMEKSYQKYAKAGRITRYNSSCTYLGLLLFITAPMYKFTINDVAQWVNVAASLLGSVGCACSVCFVESFRHKASIWYDILMFCCGFMCQCLFGLHQSRLSDLLDGDSQDDAHNVALEVVALLFFCGVISASGFYVQTTCWRVIYLLVSVLVADVVVVLILCTSGEGDRAGIDALSMCVSHAVLFAIAMVVFLLLRAVSLQERQQFLFEHARHELRREAAERELVRSLLRHVKEEEELATDALLEDFGGGKAFRFGDRVRVIKEARTKGKTACVIQPQWNGLVKVKMDEDDEKGNIKSYKARDLELIVDKPQVQANRSSAAKIVMAAREETEARELRAPLPKSPSLTMHRTPSRDGIFGLGSNFSFSGRASSTGSTPKGSTSESSPNSIFRSAMTGQVADWTRIRRMAEQLPDPKYGLQQFFEDCIISFPELKLFTSERTSGISNNVASGRSAEIEYQRTIGALFAVFWLLRLDDDGRKGFSFGVDEMWNTLKPPKIASLDLSANPDDPTGGITDPLLLFGRPFSQLSDDEKRWLFHYCTDWGMFSRLAEEAGCSGKEPEAVERRMALLCLTAFHDIMKCDDLLPVVHPEHAPYLGYAAGIQIRDHDIALSYVMQHYPDLLPSFNGLPDEQKKALLFTQGKMQFNHGWFVQAEAPPGIMLSTFKDEIRNGASGSDIALYFMHWLTDLAGAEATPRGGAEKFVLKFPHAVLSSFLWSIPYLENLADDEETAVMESYLHARWKAIAPDQGLPEDAFNIACMRLAVMAQGDYSVVTAFFEQTLADQSLLAHELALTGAEGQNFSCAMGSCGGPALLVYYGPALLQRNVARFEDLSLALWVLCQVLRAARRLWPLWAEMQGSTVTVQIGELKSMDMQQLCGNAVTPSKKMWVLVRHNDCEASVEFKDIHQINGLMRAGTSFYHLGFSRDADRDEETRCVDKSLKLSHAITSCKGRASTKGASGHGLMVHGASGHSLMVHSGTPKAGARKLKFEDVDSEVSV